MLEHHAGVYCDGIRRDVPITREVSHMLFSFSKGISATVVAMAHERGLVDYDAPLSRHIPEFTGEGREAVTIRLLLSHAAGLPAVTLPPIGIDTEASWREAVRLCCETPLQWTPGSKTEYHAITGLLLAAEAVRRRLGGRDWESICREWLFDPIGAHSLTFRVPRGVPTAITRWPKELPREIDGTTFSNLGRPGGGCFGRVEDAMKILQLHLNGGVWAGRVLLKPETFSEMHRVQHEAAIRAAEFVMRAPDHEPWGLGWLLKRGLSDHWFGFGELASARTFGHAGIETVLGVADPERDLGIVFLCTRPPEPAGDNATVICIRNMVTDLVVRDFS